MVINKAFLIIFLLASLCNPALAEKSGDSFNSASDVHWEEIELQFEGICICPRPPPVFYEEGEIWSYWEPFLVIDTVSEAFYSPYQGKSIGSSTIDELGGKNKSSDAVDIANESTFAQAHGWLFPMMELFCDRNDYGMWMSEYDSMWQDDELSALIHPEVSLFANKAMQLACMTDAASTNLGWPLDFMPWCIGSGGSSYPMTGHVDNDNIVQANNTAAARLVYKLCRLMMICDPADNLCGCNYTPVWIKSHYKMHVVRPADRSPAYPVGVSAKLYDSGLNPPYQGEKGSNDEFLWVVYRKTRCCTCCE
ncbi:TraU family protein [Myxococcota bacterium]|nr:TraU family protein [Myxococcota bacterium]